jgi:hypothetical protein
LLELTLGQATLDVDHDRARLHFRRALELYELAHDPRGRATSLTNLAGLEMFEGRYEPARAYTREARSIFEAVKDAVGVGHTTSALGFLAIKSSESHVALAHYRDALEIGGRLGSRDLVSFSLLGVAHCLATFAPAVAATLLGTADTITASLGAQRDPTDVWLHDDAAARIRDGIGDQGFEDHYRRGCALSITDAIHTATG